MRRITILIAFIGLLFIPILTQAQTKRALVIGDEYLTELTAEYSKRRVITGVTEATAIGNLALQLIASGEVKSVNEARRLIADSFPLKITK